VADWFTYAAEFEFQLLRKDRCIEIKELGCTCYASETKLENVQVRAYSTRHTVTTTCHHTYLTHYSI